MQATSGLSMVRPLTIDFPLSVFVFARTKYFSCAFSEILICRQAKFSLYHAMRASISYQHSTETRSMVNDLQLYKLYVTHISGIVPLIEQNYNINDVETASLKVCSYLLMFEHLKIL